MRIKGNYVEALKYFKKSLQIANATKDRIYVAQIYMHVGEVYIDMKKPEKAIYYLAESIRIAKEIKAKSVEQESYEYLSKAYQDMEDYKLSLDYYRTAMIIKDTLMSEKKTQKMSYLQAKFDNEQKDIQIQVLKQASELHDAELFVQKMIKTTLAIILIAAIILLTMLYYRNRDKVRQNKQLQTQQRDLIQQKNEIQQQKDELDRVNLVKDRLFSIIGHDLRSPFNTIKGFIAILKIGGLTADEIKDVTSTMEEQLNHTLNLLNNLLYWSWSQMQGIYANPEDFFINTIIEDNMALLASNASKKHITLKNNLDKRLKITADKNMIDTVIRNLLANALKFTFHKGEVIISYQDQTDHYIFCISDTGVGMSETQIQNLFGLKANSTFGTAHEKGTGLGLQICKEFLDTNNGKIWVTSKLNEGSKFYFTLLKAK